MVLASSTAGMELFKSRKPTAPPPGGVTRVTVGEEGPRMIRMSSFQLPHVRSPPEVHMTALKSSRRTGREAPFAAWKGAVTLTGAAWS